jgi:4-hydroxybenzoate polyprenyltransferase
VFLSIEAVLQQKLSLPPITYFCFIFCLTVVYYTKAYISETVHSIGNERTLWYVANKNKIFNSQIYFTVFSAVFAVLLLPNILIELKVLNVKDYLFISIFPVIGLLYYGFTSKFSLRQTHWLKPFIIGFVWSGVVTLAPLFYNQLQNEQHLNISIYNVLLFVKNLMFIAVLCIMFDIKDYATDYNQQLKTFVVSFGLRKTIFFILIPLTILGFISFLLFAFNFHFQWQRIFINTIPFIALMVVAYSMHQRRSIFYYLFIIDGLMIVKAFCGIFAAKFFS